MHRVLQGAVHRAFVGDFKQVGVLGLIHVAGQVKKAGPAVHSFWPDKVWPSRLVKVRRVDYIAGQCGGESRNQSSQNESHAASGKFGDPVKQKGAPVGAPFFLIANKRP